MPIKLKQGNIYKYKSSAWKVKVIYFTDLEICTEDLINKKYQNYLTVRLINQFLKEFELCN
jgi:hypothetical protein